MPERPMPPAGWYDDPQQPGRLRWWDGSAWQGRWMDEETPHPRGSTSPMPTRDFAWYFSFSGRMKRSEWWTVYSMVVGGMILLITMLSPALQSNGPVSLLFLVIWITSMWITLASNVKRLHDRGRSGWFLLIGVIPLVGIWVLIEIGFLRGTHGNNLYGRDPLLVTL